MSSSTLLVILLEYICVMNQNTSLSLLTTTTAASPLADSSKSTYTIASFTFELQQNNDDYCTEFPAISLCSLFTSEKEATFTDCLPQGYPVSCVTTSQYCYVFEFDNTTTTTSDNNNTYCSPCDPGTCECLSGSEMVYEQCIPCQQGFFKDKDSNTTCIKWTQPQCVDGYFPINGNRFHDAVCIPYPPIPENTSLLITTTTTTTSSWTCDAGFENSLEGSYYYLRASDMLDDEFTFSLKKQNL